MLSTFEAENKHLDKHTEPQLKKRCAYKKKMCICNKLTNFITDMQGLVKKEELPILATNYQSFMRHA